MLAAPTGSLEKSAPSWSATANAARPSAASFGAEQERSPVRQNCATRPASEPKSVICWDL